MSKLTSHEIVDIHDQLQQVHEALVELKQMALPGKAGRLVHVAELWQMQAMEQLMFKTTPGAGSEK